MIRPGLLKYRSPVFFMLLAFSSAAAYLGFSSMRGTLGFPLDDAWIHQVFARNIAARGEFSFFAGQPSAGSTSPLWTILLSIGYLLRVDYRVWAYVLGALFVGLSAIFCARLAERIFGSSPFTVYCSLFTVFEWHLAWSAVSGMEIPLFIFLSLFLVERIFAEERAWMLGLLAGLLTLTRPEGSVLAAFVAVGFCLLPRRAEREEKSLDAEKRGLARIIIFLRSPRFIRVLVFSFGFGLLVAPYLLFNLSTSGAFLPNTFYAKSAEYAILIARTPFLFRLAQTLAAPWIGAQILLLPGFVFIIVRQFKNRDWRALIPFAWILALPALYALRLPVTYQHGRYEIPIVPFLVAYGVWGTIELLGRVRSFVVRGAWGASIAAVLIAFWFVGANAYATDVAIIDCEMVQTARWAVGNVSHDSVIAAHDIGALGYFYPRPFIDLAGLVSPEVIPFIRDESRLRDYLMTRNTQYAILFPDWYDSLTRDPRFVPLFQTNCAVTRAEGGTNMMVYKILLTGQ